MKVMSVEFYKENRVELKLINLATTTIQEFMNLIKQYDNYRIVRYM